jgi:hypothetical protein
MEEEEGEFIVLTLRMLRAEGDFLPQKLRNV